MAQNMDRRQVPSVVLNNFDLQFPKAVDVEGEKIGGPFKVDFETGRSNDHTIWYNALGDFVKHERGIAKSELPVAVLSRLQADFKGYKLNEIEMVTTKLGTQDEVEVEAAFRKEWKNTLNEKRTIINSEFD